MLADLGNNAVIQRYRQVVATELTGDVILLPLLLQLATDDTCVIGGGDMLSLEGGILFLFQFAARQQGGCQ
ncbi:hypothetical protein CE456_08015 [Aeromonas salmonicida]|nr:hypothetical protein CE456_08015 [Aeromonas salmonicida]ASI26926.1 hypothetical protein CE463_08045 [Aeromonas salmonicida]ASI31044.1 hypothetical protein CE462_06940 [Aeromonas salmonicida]ATD38303.1 hypothetical protein BHG40_10345 [Aeromonas salmonicida subsp. masoucida]